MTRLSIKDFLVFLAPCTPAEACSTSNCKDYRGKQTKTRSGRTCQKWSSQTPHVHAIVPLIYPSAGLKDGPGNYCRNPDGETTIWCYTTDPKKRWDFCDPICTPTTTTTTGAPTTSGRGKFKLVT